MANKAKTAVYCRVAHADDTALENQESLLSRYAADNGYTDCALFRDNGANGLSLDRPGFNALMAEIRNGRIKTVIVKDSSRIAIDFFLLHKWLCGLGVKLVSVMDGDCEDGRKAMLKDFAEYVAEAAKSRKKATRKTS